MSSTKLTRRSKRDKRPSSASAATGDGAPNAIPIARRSTMHVYLSGFEHKKEKANLTRVSVAWILMSKSLCAFSQPSMMCISLTPWIKYITRSAFMNLVALLSHSTVK